MKLKYSFETVDMGNEIILVPVGEGAEKVHGVVKLNHEGREILELLKEETSEEAIVSSLANKYENDRATLMSYVLKAIENLRNYGLLTE